MYSNAAMLIIILEDCSVQYPAVGGSPYPPLHASGSACPGLGGGPPGNGCIVPEGIGGGAGEGHQFAAGHPPPLLSWRLGHGKALAQLVPMNLLRVHDVGEEVRGETEVEVSTKQDVIIPLRDKKIIEALPVVDSYYVS